MKCCSHLLQDMPQLFWLTFDGLTFVALLLFVERSFLVLMKHKAKKKDRLEYLARWKSMGEILFALIIVRIAFSVYATSPWWQYMERF